MAVLWLRKALGVPWGLLLPCMGFPRPSMPRGTRVQEDLVWALTGVSQPGDPRKSLSFPETRGPHHSQGYEEEAEER